MISMDRTVRYWGSGWKATERGPKLTDRRIERYRKLGYYSAEFREERRKLMEKKAFKTRMDRVGEEEGNFRTGALGQLIYSPR